MAAVASADDDALDLGHGATAVAEVRDVHQCGCADDFGSDDGDEQRLAGVGVDGGEGFAVDGVVGVAFACFVAEVELLQQMDHGRHVADDGVADDEAFFGVVRHLCAIGAHGGRVEVSASPSSYCGRVFSEAADVRLGLAVWVFSGPTNTDADFEAYLASIARLDLAMLGAGVKHPAVIQVVDEGNQIPNSHWRRRIAEATRVLHCRPLFALVTTSTLVRGVATAINWIRPPRYEVVAWATFDQAVSWVERRRGHSARLHALLAEARASPGAPAT